MIFEEICEAIRGAMEETETSGVAVGLLQDGEEQVAGFGVTSVENPLDVTPDTLFQIGSITKTFTATAAMRLVERGELDLDAPIRTYLPELKLADEDVAARVTARHLFTHTGGWIGDYFDDLGAGDDALARMVEEIRILPQLTPLGEVWSYNNAGFYLAGRIIERITKQTFEQAVQDLVLDPLGLENTFFFADDVMTRRFCVGHLRGEEDRPAVARPWSIGRAAHPAGGLSSTVGDLLRYARFHMSDGEGVLSRASLDEMQREQFPVGASFDAVGLTWMRSQFGTRLALGHGGGTNGQISIFAYVPEEHLAYAVLTNYQRGGEVIAAVERVVGLAPPERRPIEFPAEEYLGRYTSTVFDAELRRENGGLSLIHISNGGFPRKDSPPMPSPPPMHVAFYAADRLFVTDGPFKNEVAEFLRAPDGSIAWFRVGGRIMSRD